MADEDCPDAPAPNPFVALQASYRARARVTMLEASAHWRQVAEAEASAAERRGAAAAVASMVRRLAESGGTFGFPAFSAAAARLETSLAAVARAASMPTTDQGQEISRRLDELRRSL